MKETNKSINKFTKFKDEIFNFNKEKITKVSIDKLKKINKFVNPTSCKIFLLKDRKNKAKEEDK